MVLLLCNGFGCVWSEHCWASGGAQVADKRWLEDFPFESCLRTGLGVLAMCFAMLLLCGFVFVALMCWFGCVEWVWVGQVDW